MGGKIIPHGAQFRQVAISQPLVKRQARLQALRSASAARPSHYPLALLHVAEDDGLAGIVSKRRDALRPVSFWWQRRLVPKSQRGTEVHSRIPRTYPAKPEMHSSLPWLSAYGVAIRGKSLGTSMPGTSDLQIAGDTRLKPIRPRNLRAVRRVELMELTARHWPVRTRLGPKRTAGFPAVLLH